jgi:hypothetical protein
MACRVRSSESGIRWPYVDSTSAALCPSRSATATATTDSP